MSEASKKASKFSYNNGVDRLSALPDAILCHILSFLDTKYAVATTVLSARWNNLHLTLPDIVFDHSLTGKKRTKKFELDFAKFALRQIVLRNVPYINRFRLQCNFNFKESLTRGLINTAIWRNVKELDICTTAHTFQSWFDLWRRGLTRVVLPSEVFTCRSLVVLKLGQYLELDVPESVNLPNLKVLFLNCITLDDYDSMRRLFDGCKLLEDLSLSACRIFKNVDVVDLSIRSLRRLAIRLMYDAAYKFIIDMPNLEVFEYHGGKVDYQFVNKPKYLDRVKISLVPHEKHCVSLYELMSKMHGVKSLYLSDVTLMVMDSSCNSLPVLNDLTRLELCLYDLQVLSSILESTPQLQELILSHSHGCYRGVENLCSPPKIVLTCWAKHLNNIEFKCFRARECEFELAKYFLQNGEVLKRMKFSMPKQLGAEDVLATFNRISRFPKCSEKCEIQLVSKK